MTDHTDMGLATLDALRARLEQVEAERDAMVEVLKPFARAWRHRAPVGDPSSRVYRRRMDRALLPFLSYGNADDDGVLTGQHLVDAYRAVEGRGTSLARRDARVKAEALERAIWACRQPMTEGGQPWLIRVEDVQAMADEYRRYAEEEGS